MGKIGLKILNGLLNLFRINLLDSSRCKIYDA